MTEEATTKRPATGRPDGSDDAAPDLREHGAPVRGEPQTSTRRLFVQLHVFTGCLSTAAVISEVRSSGLDAVVYADLNDPRGVGVLLMSEDPARFAEAGLDFSPVLDPDNPLRRIGAFNQLPRAEQGKILMEHGMLGRRYGEAGYAVDVRLECHGLDQDDNEFVIGLIGPQLYPLSKLVKDMRATRQTSEFIQQMGPFFVGKVLFQSDYESNVSS